MTHLVDCDSWSYGLRSLSNGERCPMCHLGKDEQLGTQRISMMSACRSKLGGIALGTVERSRGLPRKDTLLPPRTPRRMHRLSFLNLSGYPTGTRSGVVFLHSKTKRKGDSP